MANMSGSKVATSGQSFMEMDLALYREVKIFQKFRGLLCWPAWYTFQ